MTDFDLISAALDELQVPAGPNAQRLRAVEVLRRLLHSGRESLREEVRELEQKLDDADDDIAEAASEAAADARTEACEHVADLLIRGETIEDALRIAAR